MKKIISREELEQEVKRFPYISLNAIPYKIIKAYVDVRE